MNNEQNEQDGTQNWTTGSDQHDLNKDSIFIDGSIKRFLETDKMFLIVASKGMGKTLFLRYKRKILQDHHASKSILIIPENSGGELDRVQLNPNTSLKTYKKKKDEIFWRDMWLISITLSILTYIDYHSS